MGMRKPIIIRAVRGVHASKWMDRKDGWMAGTGEGEDFFWSQAGG